MRVSRRRTGPTLLSFLLLLLLPVAAAGYHLSSHATRTTSGTVSRVTVQRITTVVLSESVTAATGRRGPAPVVTENPSWGEDAVSPRGRALRQRDGTCPAAYDACATVGAGDSCCRSGTYCTTDWLSNVACCPLGETCTGIQPPRWSYLHESYFPWRWVPRSFTDGGACSSWYTWCQGNYVKCVENRQHSTELWGGPGVSLTLVSPGGDVTPAHTTSSLRDRVSQAISNCNRLGVDAGCGFQLSRCDRLPTATPVPTPTTQSLSFGKRAAAARHQPRSTSGAGSAAVSRGRAAMGGVVACLGVVLQVLCDV